MRDLQLYSMTIIVLVDRDDDYDDNHHNDNYNDDQGLYTKVHIPSNGHNDINHGDRDHVDDDSNHQ